MAVDRRAAAVLLLSLPGCYASNVVAHQDRAVVADLGDLIWEPAAAEHLAGLWESVEIRGEAAAGLWKIYYLFEAGGRYTAAALVAGAGGRAFQTLDGSWECRDGSLVLDADAPVQVGRAADHLRIDAPTGSVTLRRVVLQ